jgi:hypothetical protein
MKEWFSAYPPFWYYYGVAQEGEGDIDGALSSYNMMESIRIGYLRHDGIYSSMLMRKNLLGREHKGLDVDINALQSIEAQSSKDWQKILYAAIQYWQAGNLQKTLDLLQINIDEGREPSLNYRVRASVLAKDDPEKYENVVLEFVNSDTTRNQDVLYLLGEMSTEAILDKFYNQIEGVKLQLNESYIGSDSIVLTLPVRWVLDGANIQKISMKYSSWSYDSLEIEADSNSGTVAVTFKLPFEISKAILDTKTYLLQFIVPGIDGDVVFRWTIAPVDRVVRKDSVDIASDKTASYLEDSYNSWKSIIGAKKRKANSEDVSVDKEITELVSSLEWVSAYGKCFKNNSGDLSVLNSCK